MSKTKLKTKTESDSDSDLSHPCVSCKDIEKKIYLKRGDWAQCDGCQKYVCSRCTCICDDCYKAVNQSKCRFCCKTYKM